VSTVVTHRHGDSSLVLRTLTVILLSGGSLLAALRDPNVMISHQYLAGIALLWGALGLELLPVGSWFTRGRLDALMVAVDIVAVALVVAAVPELPGVSIYFLGPVASAAVRLGREGATAAAAAAALGLLLPVLFAQSGLQPIDVQTAVGAVLLLASGLAAGELVRLAETRRREERESSTNARRVGHELRMILDNLGSGLLTVDARGNVTRVNPAARGILGIGDRTTSQLHIGEILGPDGDELTLLVTTALNDGRRRKRAEVSVVRNGQPVPLGVNVDFLAAEDGRLAGAVVIFSELTEVQRLREHLRRTDRLAGVGELAASIAHELRNPLASIRGSIEILAGELDVHDQHEQLMQLVLRESNRLNTIITDFLAFARMPSPCPRPVDLERFLSDVQLQLRQHVAAKEAAVDVVFAHEAPGVKAVVDPDQLLQAILNLSINACEAMHDQGQLRILCDVVEDAVQLRIIDTGPGLPEGRLEEIFTPFVTTKQNGTGLGLPMVARIIHGHGGTVEAGNTAAGGAEFVIRLPLTETTEATEIPEEAAVIGELASVH
jgi:two-component system sensor histidine kinase PilS (NtrC family)